MRRYFLFIGCKLVADYFRYGNAVNAYHRMLAQHPTADISLYDQDCEEYILTNTPQQQ